MKHVPLLFPFFLALVAAVCASVFFPHFRLHPFSPFLALLYCRCSRMSSLWIGSLCGLIIDLFSSKLCLGVYALSFSAATLVLYPQKKRFYSDKPFALSLFTFLISAVITLSLFIFSRLSHSVSPISVKWLMSDFILMSFFDAIYAFLWFSLPMLLYRHMTRVGLRPLFSKISFPFKRKKCSE